MRVSTIIAAITLAGLVGCVKPASDYPAASLQTYDINSVRGDNPATVRGTFNEGSFFGKATLATFVASIDGKLEVESGYTTPVPLEPGPHALVIGYWQGSTRMPVPVRLEAEPGKRYLILQEKGRFDFNLLRGSSFPSYVYIVDESTGLPVTPKMVDDAKYASEYYAEPTGDKTATIRGTVERKGFNEPYAAYVLAVDGKYAPMTAETDFTNRQPIFDSVVRLEPGVRAIGIGLRASLEFAVYSVLLDVRPGETYALRQETGLKRIGNSKWSAITVWIENEKTGDIVWPKTDLPVTRMPF